MTDKVDLMVFERTAKAFQTLFESGSIEYKLLAQNGEVLDDNHYKILSGEYCMNGGPSRREDPRS